MGQAESKEVTQDTQFVKLSKIVEQKGPTAARKYLQENVYKWKEETVSFAVTGRSATGKSTFINKLRNVKPGDPGFAKSGSGDTTTKPTAYQNPQNNKIVFYDLPGVGTMDFKKDTYVSRMNLCQYDYFFIFFDKVVSEDDYFLVEALVEMKKPFSLVRSKIDDDLRNAKDDGKREEDVIPEIRMKIKNQISRFTHLKNSDAVFLISSKNIDIGDWHELLCHIEKCLTAPKFETFVYSVPLLTEHMIEVKYNILRTRVKIASFSAAAIAAVPIPGIAAVANISILVEEVLHYKNVFGLTATIIALLGLQLFKLNCAAFLVGNEMLAEIVIKELGNHSALLAVESAISCTLIIGQIISSVTSAVLTYRFLINILDKFRDDAVTVYRFQTRNQRA